jgi:hypothetical protein
MVRVLLAVGAIFFASAAVSDAHGVATVGDWHNARPKIEVQVRRANAADRFVILATISDLKTGKTLAQPKLETRAAIPARIEVGAKGEPGLISVDATVTVSPSGTTASYTSEVHDNDQVISSQTATLAISG